MDTPPQVKTRGESAAEEKDEGKLAHIAVCGGRTELNRKREVVEWSGGVVTGA